VTEDIGFDFSEMNKLAADLGDAGRRDGKKIRQAVEVTAFKVKKAWADKLKGEPHLPHAPRSIGYDLLGTALSSKSDVTAEIGAETGKLQAPIVTVIEFGSPHSIPKGYGLAALQENQADFIKGLGLAVDPLGP
jgi:hypothetical protein